MTFQKKLILGVAGFLGLATSLLFIWPDAEAANLEALVEDLAIKARAGDVEGCMALVHEGYDHRGFQIEDVENQVRGYLRSEYFRELKLEDISADVSGDDGRVTFTAHVFLKIASRTAPYNVVMHFRRFDGEWMITGYDVDGPGSR